MFKFITLMLFIHNPFTPPSEILSLLKCYPFPTNVNSVKTTHKNVLPPHQLSKGCVQKQTTKIWLLIPETKV